MLSLIESIMGFVYKHTELRQFVYYIVSTIVGFGFFVWCLIYINIGQISVNPKLFLMPELYFNLMTIYKKEVAIFLIIEQLFFILMYFYFTKSRLGTIKPNDDEVEKIYIEELCKIWIDSSPEQLKDELFIALNRNDQIPANVSLSFKDSLLKTTNFTILNSNVLINEVVKPNLVNIDVKYVEVIIRLIHLLEANKDCPSVVAACKSDPNITYGYIDKKDKAKKPFGDGDSGFVRVEKVTLDGKTRFDVYEQVSLYEHSLAVAMKIVKLLKNDKDNAPKISKLIGPAIVVALAHDIGKISTYETKEEAKHQGKNVFVELQKKQPHQELSYMIFYDLFKDCPDLKLVALAIKSHHDGAIDKENILLQLLVRADKETRSDELHNFLQNYNASDISQKSINANEKLADSTDNKAPLETVSKIPASKPKVIISDNIQDDAPVQADLKIHTIEGGSNMECSDMIADAYGQFFGSTTKKKHMLFVADHLSQNNYISDITNAFNGTILDTYTQNSILFSVAKEGNRQKVIEYFNNIDKVKYPNIHFGFAMFRDCNDISEALNGAKEAFEIAKSQNAYMYDYKSILDSKQENANKASNSKEVVKTESKVEKSGLNDNLNDLLGCFDEIDSIATKIKPQTNKEENFDVDSIERVFINELKAKMNTAIFFGTSRKVVSVCYKKLLLVSYDGVKEALAVALNIPVKELNDGKVNFLIRHYRHHHDENKRLIFNVTPEKGFYTSKYNMKNDGSAVSFNCVPFDLKRSFGMSAAEAEVHKNNSQVADVKIWSYQRS